MYRQRLPVDIIGNSVALLAGPSIEADLRPGSTSHA